MFYTDRSVPALTKAYSNIKKERVEFKTEKTPIKVSNVSNTNNNDNGTSNVNSNNNAAPTPKIPSNSTTPKTSSKPIKRPQPNPNEEPLGQRVRKYPKIAAKPALNSDLPSDSEGSLLGDIEPNGNILPRNARPTPRKNSNGSIQPEKTAKLPKTPNISSFPSAAPPGFGTAKPPSLPTARRPSSADYKPTESGVTPRSEQRPGTIPAAARGNGTILPATPGQPVELNRPKLPDQSDPIFEWWNFAERTIHMAKQCSSANSQAEHAIAAEQKAKQQSAMLAMRLEEQIKRQDEDVNAKDSEISRLNDLLQARDRAAEAQKAEIAHLQEQISTRKRMSESQGAGADRLFNKLKAKESAFEKLQSDYSELKKSHDALKDIQVSSPRVNKHGKQKSGAGCEECKKKDRELKSLTEMNVKIVERATSLENNFWDLKNILGPKRE